MTCDGKNEPFFEHTGLSDMSSHTILPAAAIDLGFHTTKYSFCKLPDSADARPCGQIPSIAPCLPAPMEDATGYQLDGTTVSVNGSYYFVGPHAQRMVGAAGLHRAASAEYSTTPEYHALLLGALWHIARDGHKGDGSLRIEHLTLGLPMAITSVYRKQLKELATGEHSLPAIQRGGKPIKVYVTNVHVLSQPQGALLHFSDTVDHSVQDENVVVADLGGGTFDWFSCASMVPTLPQCDSHHRGMLNAATEACKLVAPHAVNDLGLLARIDEALRHGHREVKITGRMVPFGDALSAAHKVIDEALRHMAISIGSSGSIDRLLLAGGGAPLLKARLPHVLPHLSEVAVMVEDPFYANVRGFLFFSVAMYEAK